jgi:hypothetical protein
MPRAGLSSERVVSEAALVADEGGLDALTASDGTWPCWAWPNWPGS